MCICAFWQLDGFVCVCRGLKTSQTGLGLSRCSSSILSTPGGASGALTSPTTSASMRGLSATTAAILTRTRQLSSCGTTCQKTQAMSRCAHGSQLIFPGSVDVL